MEFTAMELSFLDVLAYKVGYAYLSDLRYIDGIQRLKLLRTLEKIPAEAVPLREWHPTKNGKRTLDSLTYGSQKKVWWRCNHGHVWQAAVYSRAGPQKCGCPVCAGRVNKKRMERYAAMMAGAALHNNT